MPYPINIEEAGGYYHIYFKSNHDRFVLTVDEDNRTLAAFMHHYKRKHKVKIITFAIMSNHVHLLLKNSNDDPDAIKKFLRDTKREFAKYHNIRYGTKGSLWARSYRQKAIQGDIQLINTIVYILNNPVKAKLAPHAWQYPWSASHQVFTKEQYKKMSSSNRYLDKKDFKMLVLKAKLQKYGEGLSDVEQARRGLDRNIDQNKYRDEIITGRKEHKRRGPRLHYFPRQPKHNMDKKTGLISMHLTDPLPVACRPRSALLRQLCRQRDEFNSRDPFRIDGMLTLYEAPKRNVVEAFQKHHAARLPDNASHPYSIIETDVGWALVAVRGRRRRSA